MSANRRIKRKINVIDVIIILLVLALIGTGVYKVYSELTKENSSKQGNYVVTFECDSEYRNLVNYLKSGDAVYFSTNGNLMGYLYDAPGDDVGAVYEIAKKTDNGLETEEETKVAGKVPYSKVKLGGRLKLASSAVKAKGSQYYTVGERNISVGSTLEVYTSKSVFTLTVKSIGTTAQ